MNTLSGEVTLPFHFCVPSNVGSTIKGKNLLQEEQILSFKSRPLLKGFCFPEKQARSQKLSPIEIMAEKCESVSILLI